MYGRTATLLSALALAFATAASAAAQQTTTGTISGRVADAQNLSIPGATVAVIGPQGTKTAVTDAEGRFSVPFLTPGMYTVRAELEGFRSVEQRNVNVSLGQRVGLNLTMEIGALTETVEVTVAAPVVDTSTTTIGGVLGADLLNSAPVGRKMTDALYLVPGVSSGGEVGRANPSVAGGSGLENQYIVDGTNITNAGYGAIGSYSIVFGSLGSGVTYDFVKEIQVKTGGYEAEYGQATGGVVNVVTKSGSNDFSGSAFGYFRPEALESTWTPLVLPNLTQVAANRTGTHVNDTGFEMGGPIYRDRAFFFGALNPQWETETFIGLPGSPLRELLGEVDRNRNALTYSGKATFQMGGNHSLTASVFGDPSEGELGPQRKAAFRRADTKGFSSIDYGGHNQIVKYDGVMSPNWLLEASYAHAMNKLEETPSANEWQFTDRTVSPNLSSGGIGFFEANEGTNHQYQVKATGLFGDHQLRAGFGFEQIDYLQGSNRTGPTLVTSDGTRTATGAQVQILPAPELPSGRLYRIVRSNFQAFRETEQQYLNFFAQDTWQVGNHLVIRPGIRYEQQKLVGNLEDFKWNNNWAPRIGASYDPVGDGRSKIYGNWGRFFAKVPNDLAARALSADAGVTRDDYYDAALTQPIPAGTLAAGTTTHYLTAGLNAADFDPDSKSTYLDETLVGVEHEILPGLNLGVRYVHREFGRVLEDVGTAPMISYVLDVPGLDSVEYFITNPSRNTPVVAAPPGFNISFEEAIHDYDAVEVTADKRFADRWGLQASYRWSRLYGTFEGFYRNDNEQSDPAITSLFDFPINDPSYTALGGPLEGFRGDIRYLGALGAGPLPNDRTHQGKLYGNYSFDNGLNLGLGMFVSSGSPLTALAANPAYDSPGEIPETPRGGGFQTIDGFKTRTPVESSFDLHADYRLRLGNQRLVLLADVFNVFDQQAVLNYDHYTESSFTALNPDFGRPFRYQTPRQVRMGVRFQF